MNDLLKQYFGYDEFRPGQKEIIQKVIDQENVLGIMPTGSGTVSYTHLDVYKRQVLH